MGIKKRMDFCIECRKDTAYTLKKKTIIKKIKEKEYPVNITIAICVECGKEMSIPGLIDKNIREVDEQYRAAEGIISIDDIEKLMKIYKLGKAPLSLALGFGEVTITRYLEGQIPSKEYSDIMRMALTSPAYMKELLENNKSRIAHTAYNKAMTAAVQMETLFSVSEKMLRVIAYVFKSLEEVTPLMLQKLLYIIQGVFMALYKRPIFEEECMAWMHGPVYPEVYELFRDFKYNPIDDARFAVFEGTADALTDEERNVIDLVVNTFGNYSGKVLEKITHNEEPWKLARKGYSDNIPSNEPISKESMKVYYEKVHREYGIDSEEGMKRYIHTILGKGF
jgi:putative prophage ps3 protein 01